MTPVLFMLQEPFRKAGFGEQDYHGVTTIHPLGLLAILILGLACVLVPRRYAVVPLLVSACLIPSAQRLVIFTLDFSLLRILIMCAWARILIRGEASGMVWGRLDSHVCAWLFAGTMAYLALHQSTQALIFQLGYLYDVLGLYFFLRCVLRDWRDVETVVQAMALLCIPVALMFAVEKATGRNHFSVLGGVPAMTAIREGRLRAQGPFPHPILAGCFFAAWLPMLTALCWKRGKRWLGALGVIATLSIVFACSSSTPVGGVAAALVGAVVWKARNRMRLLRWGVLFTLIGLHMVMKAPVWHLLSRISFSRGSTSYHRYLLIDNAIEHASEWVLIGAKATGHWGHAMYDLTNQFILEGVKGGLLALLLFVLVCATAFSGVGRLWRENHPAKHLRALSWGIGVSMFVHVAMFFSISISHSQQNLLVLFFVLAGIGSLCARPPSARNESIGQRRPVEPPRPWWADMERRGVQSRSL